MFKYMCESDDFSMDVQVGPDHEIEAEMDEPVCNPVDCAKKNPETVPVACVEKEDGVNEFYVDASDVIKLAELNECSLVSALNGIIAANEMSSINSGNLITVFNEENREYASELMNAGAICAMDEGEGDIDDIDIHVQNGPGGEEMDVSEDPQVANPVDAVKREYDNVVVAKNDDEFFMDVEDVQKCADINCESVIDTLNNIIATHEEFEMNGDNIVLIVNESTDEDTIDLLNEYGVMMEMDLSELNDRRKLMNKAMKIINQFCVNNAVTDAMPSKWFSPIKTANFIKGSSDEMAFAIADTTTRSVGRAALNALLKLVNSKKNELKKALEDGLDCKVSSISARSAKFGSVELVVKIG